MRKRFQWRDVLVKRIIVVVLVSVTSHTPPPPTSAESGGTFAHSSSPEPPYMYLVESVPPIATKGTPFPPKMGTHRLPLNVFDGADFRIVSEFKIVSLCLTMGIYMYVIKVLKFHCQKLPHSFDVVKSPKFLFISGIRRQ